MKCHNKRSLYAALIAGITLPCSVLFGQTQAELEARVEALRQELAQAEAELAAAGGEASSSPSATASTVAEAEPKVAPPADKIEIGPFKIGGAIRANYVIGDYPTGNGPTRGADGGNVMLDTFRINVDFASGAWLGKFEYRWYNGYNFLHTGWLGYDLEENGTIQVGVNRVPFGPGAYGVSNSWFFDQHYYVGLSDDMDLGIKWSTSPIENLDLDLAYYYGDEGQWKGASKDSARYSYDPVVGADGSGYHEKNTFVARAIYHLPDLEIPTDIGVSAQYGELHANGTVGSDGEHLALSAHMVNQIGGFTVKSQITAYHFDHGSDNPWGSDELILMGAYDFAWPVASEAIIPAVTVSYVIETPQVGWLDSITPYVEYSSIIKDEDGFNDSELFIIGAAWARGGWYVYTDWALSNGNYFVGSDGDDYSTYAGVGDFGINGNDKWNARFNINFGYYF
jgi:hypothetical protein